jgi:hypothetical protein
LHYVAGEKLPIVPAGSGAAGELTFASAEPLERIAARLKGTEFSARILSEDSGSLLRVTDPDGREAQVRTPPVA